MSGTLPKTAKIACELRRLIGRGAIKRAKTLITTHYKRRVCLDLLRLTSKRIFLSLLWSISKKNEKDKFENPSKTENAQITINDVIRLFVCELNIDA